MDDTGQGAPRPDLSPWWRHAAILVMVFGFTILTIVTVKTYSNAPPVPVVVAGPGGEALFTRADIERGQEVFFKYALMEHGTLWGHGAYLGPDYSAEYLHRLTDIGRDTLAQARYGKQYTDLETGQAFEIAEAARLHLKQNRYDSEAQVLRFTESEAASLRIQKEEWRRYFSEENAAPGLPAKYIKNREETDALAGYFAWAAWATVANRPGKDYSYTNNWPYDRAAGNVPTSSTYLWSALSLV